MGAGLGGVQVVPSGQVIGLRPLWQLLGFEGFAGSEGPFTSRGERSSDARLALWPPSASEGEVQLVPSTESAQPIADPCSPSAAGPQGVEVPRF